MRFRLTKGVVIRIVIYGTLIAYFGWRQIERIRAERAAEERAEQKAGELEGAKRSVTLPDGSTQDVYYINPEQAKRLFGIDPDAEPPGAGPEAKTEVGAEGASAPNPAVPPSADDDGD